MTKVKGTLLSSALIMLMVISIVFSAQLLSYRTHVLTYQHQIRYYKAKALQTLAKKINLAAGQTAFSDQGKVKATADKLIVTLNTKDVYYFEK